MKSIAVSGVNQGAAEEVFRRDSGCVERFHGMVCENMRKLLVLSSGRDKREDVLYRGMGDDAKRLGSNYNKFLGAEWSGLMEKRRGDLLLRENCVSLALYAKALGRGIL